jgi:hypothetical protein
MAVSRELVWFMQPGDLRSDISLDTSASEPNGRCFSSAGDLPTAVCVTPQLSFADYSILDTRHEYVRIDSQAATIVI